MERVIYFIQSTDSNINFTHTLTDTLRMTFDQMSGHPHDPVKLALKINHHILGRKCKVLAETKHCLFQRGLDVGKASLV